ncbi:MAG: carbamoyl phosphate synthase small subunit [Lachnospiraceae bacterium]|jgi:carbamoyl-phosphate synthase small subunit|nr:carbamoyl phosphate synthase small subunit [Lachnospiraceae bacterium]MEE3461283.1 carbamoyl phosphate synthase small subunit [Lachnospiraceae bacterium]
MKAFLILEDGTVFTGKHFGAEREVISEIVFNTSMTGYLEVLTDPSYAGQAVTMTYPLIGNYGVALDDMESKKAWPDGFIVREMSGIPSNFRSEESLQKFLDDNDIPGISGIDTRALTKILREKGTMNGMITTDENYDLDKVLPKIKEYKVTGVVKRVSRKEAQTFEPGDLGTDKPDPEDQWIFEAGASDVDKKELEARKKKFTNKPKSGKRVAVIDVGTKNNIIRCLLKRGCSVKVYPCDFRAEDVIGEKPDGIMITNGPGDPSEVTDIIEEIKKLYESGIPIFAICLGHQLMALANGALTFKMKYGHRGANHPVKDLESGRVFISTQNHGYCVDEKTFDPEKMVPWFINVNDKTIEGVRYLQKPVKTVQFHPEASAGPKDTEWLFDEFIKMMGGND